MNAAAKSLGSGYLFRGNIRHVKLSRESMTMIVLLVLSLMTALAIVYIKNEQRILFAQLQQAHTIKNRLQVEKGQLLIEQTSLATPSRVQAIAVNQLNMKLPAVRQTLIMHR